MEVDRNFTTRLRCHDIGTIEPFGPTRMCLSGNPSYSQPLPMTSISSEGDSKSLGLISFGRPTPPEWVCANNETAATNTEQHARLFLTR